MSELLRYTMFQQILFPEQQTAQDRDGNSELILNRVIRFQPALDLLMADATITVFDFETTGLDPREDRIIEIGAQKLVKGKAVDQFSQLIKPDISLSAASRHITGITEEMLENQPPIAQILPRFLNFIEGSILVAHNAEFDMSFLKASCQRLGYQLSWPCFCTLKMARQMLPDLESKSLDSLAQYFGLSFESRHRSVGDVKVTSSVLLQLMQQDPERLSQWQLLDPFKVV